MSKRLNYKNFAVVTAILPQYNANDVIDAVLAAGESSALLLNARGTLVRERWYQAFLPVMSPEKEYLQFLVPESEIEHFVHVIVSAGDLHLPGAGAVFAVPCDDLVCSESFPLWSGTIAASPDTGAGQNLRENLTAVFCVVQTDQTEAISRAAMNAGAHGPVVFYCEGRGLRDRLGWLRITKKNDKEVIVIIVDNADAVAVTEAMIDAGDIDLPGRGFLYRMPVNTGLINIGSTFGRRRHAASIQQIISAIDEIKGTTDWRDQGVSQLVGTGKSAGIGIFGKVKERTYLTNQCIVTVIVSRRHVDCVIDAALAAGAPGANISYAKRFEATATDDESRHGFRLNRERAVIRLVLAEGLYATVSTAIQDAVDAHEIDEICFFRQPVTRAITYLPGTAEAPKRGVTT